jgi:hypothetical protein
MKKFWKVLLGRDRLLDLPLKERLLISYLGGYNCGEISLGRRIFIGLRLTLPNSLWARSS